MVGGDMEDLLGFGKGEKEGEGEGGRERERGERNEGENSSLISSSLFFDLFSVLRLGFLYSTTVPTLDRPLGSG